MTHLIIEESKALKEQLIGYRRHLHQNPEIGMEVTKTAEFVKTELDKMGITYEEISKNGIVATIGGSKPGKTILLRGDMDALPIKENTGLSFAAMNNKMHACGHDFHTTMLLGAAKIIKGHEDEIYGTVKLMFQPGEEIIVGAFDMIKHGVLENPTVDLAFMIHLFPNLEIKSGTLLIPNAGPTTLASDWFDIEIIGKGGHGAMPNVTIDPLNVAAHLHLALQSLNSRETSPLETTIVTIGVMEGGDTANVIPEKALLKGTVRTFDKENRRFILERIEAISNGIAATFRATCNVTIKEGCPSIVCAKEAVDTVTLAMQEMLPPSDCIKMSDIFKDGKILFSEDFSFITERCDGAILLLTSGDARDGYCYPLHHPKVNFDEAILTRGAAIHAQTALYYCRKRSD